MQPLDLGQLEALDALLQEGSVTRAARRVGLSTPAMSHALARMREALGDPLLVRSGRAMVLTPHADALRPQVRALLTEARRVLSPPGKLSPAELRRDFVIHATDHVLMAIGPALDRILSAEAPLVTLRFLPNSADDAAALRDAVIDMAIGIYGQLPPELRTRVLLTDRFVCVVREGNPHVGKRLTLDRYVALEHVQIAPRGKPGGYVDDVLAERGLSRRVTRAVPYFLAGLLLVSKTDHVLTVSERIATPLAASLGLRVLEPPVSLDPYALSALWHPRHDADPGHVFLRDAVTRAAKASTAGSHQGARVRLASAARRKRPR